jgi:peptidoglycan/LPS O-acetylase OafA/YrhL
LKSVALRDDSSHDAVVTGLRGGAALWVFLYHAWVCATPRRLTVSVVQIDLDFTPLLSAGFAGVSIFFVLSGYLLARPLAEWHAGLRNKPALGQYVFRRVMRVFPAYYAQLILLLWVNYRSGNPQHIDFAGLCRHLFMLFTPPPLGTQPLNGVWWTLPIEFSFYLVLPFLAFSLKFSRWWLILVGSLAIMMLWRHFVVVDWQMHRFLSASLPPISYQDPPTCSVLAC